MEIDLKDQQVELSNACVYYERCPITSKKALGGHEFRPKLHEVEDDHFVACCAVEHKDPLY